MAEKGSGQTNRAGRALPAIALAMWVVVIVVSAGRRPTEPPLIGVEDLDIVLLVLLLVGAVFGLILLIIINPFQSEWKEPARRRGSLGFLLLFVAVVGLLFWQPQFLIDMADRAEDQEENTLPDEELFDVTERTPPETVAEATDLLVIAAVVGMIISAIVMLRRRNRPTSDSPDELLEAELITAIDQARLELEDDGDPRTAVLNAYRRLEVVLEDRGSARRDSETAAEHITRSLLTLPVDPAPFVQLGGLYELARFSAAAVTGDHRASAMAALERARAELAAEPTTPAP
ncbi:MAG: DUF4129 domain-containing protein [Actinomycetota bacterium]